jgi:hypothetical protein
MEYFLSFLLLILLAAISWRQFSWRRDAAPVVSRDDVSAAEAHTDPAKW